MGVSCRGKYLLILLGALGVRLVTGEEAPGSRLDALMGSLTDAQKAGQVIMGGFSGRTLSVAVGETLSRGRVGSVILFANSDNLTGPGQVADLTQALQDAARQGGLPPLLVAIDQEGGRVNRLSRGVTQFPGAMALGAARDRALARQVAEATARQLRELGITMNLAPVADVNTNPDNPVIGSRSFGADPREVAELAWAMAQGFWAGGVIPVAKHYPGHGDARVDSHVGLPRIDHNRARLDRVELFPFRLLAERGIPALMTGHLVVPALDGGIGLPATLSPDLLGTLRRDWQYDGLVISDSLSMGAIRNTWGQGEASVRALAAGVDLVLVGEGRSLEGAQRVHQALLRALDQGRLPRARLDEAVRRVLRAKLEAADPPPGPGGPDPERLARQVARASLTWVKKPRGLLPLGPRSRAALIWPRSHRASGQLLCQALPGLTPYYASLHPDQAERRRLARALRAHRVILAGCFDLGLCPGWARLLQALPKRRLILLSLRAPYDLMWAPRAAGALAAYSSQPASLEALAQALRGTLRPAGRLPVTLPSRPRH